MGLIYNINIRNQLRSIKEWLHADVRGKTWIFAGETAFLVSSFVIADLGLKPLFSYYAESSYLGEFATHIILGVIISYLLCYLFIPQFKKGLRKRYIIAIKFLFLPIVGLVMLLLISSKPFYKETIHDLPRGASK